MIRQRAHLVTIKGVGSNPRAGVEFQAYLRESVDFDVRIYYDSIFRDVLKWREAVGKVMVTAEEIAGMLGHATSYFEARVFGRGVAWTRKFGGVPEHLEFSLPCRIWIEDNIDEVFRSLEKLYDIAVPELGKAVSVYKQHTVMVAVGGWFVVEEAIITKIGHKWSEAYVRGVPAWCDIDIDVSTVYAVDRIQLNLVGNRITVRKMGEVAEVAKVG